MTSIILIQYTVSEWLKLVIISMSNKIGTLLEFHPTEWLLSLQQAIIQNALMLNLTVLWYIFHWGNSVGIREQKYYICIQQWNKTSGNQNMLYHPTSCNFNHTSVQDVCICPWEGANDLMTGVWVHPSWKRECVFSSNLNPNLPLLFRQLPPQPHRLPFV